MKERNLRAGGAVSRIMVGTSGHFDQALSGDVDPLFVVDEGFYRSFPRYTEDYGSIVISAGESVKSLKQMEKLYQEFFSRNLERSSLVVACGGGTVCDVVGFAAATYLRGVRFGVVATTLLAQVDASIGGKNGVNYSGYKNLIGTIRQPEFCVCDSALLASLPAKDICEGFAEAEGIHFRFQLSTAEHIGVGKALS